MIAVVMAGGKGTRMSLDGEKLLLRYKKPIILHVVDSLKNSDCFSKILAVTSPHSPKTRNLLKENDVETFDAAGTGYVEDLNSVLQTIDDDVLVTSGDLPLLDEEIVREIAGRYDPRVNWTSILVEDRFLASLGLSSGCPTTFENKTCHYTGISLVNSRKIYALEKLDENHIILDDKRVALNLNTRGDCDLLGIA